MTKSSSVNIYCAKGRKNGKIKKVSKKHLTEFSTGLLEKPVDFILEIRGFTQFPQSFPQAQSGKAFLAVENSKSKSIGHIAQTEGCNMPDLPPERHFESIKPTKAT